MVRRSVLLAGTLVALGTMGTGLVPGLESSLLPGLVPAAHAQPIGTPDDADGSQPDLLGLGSQRRPQRYFFAPTYRRIQDGDVDLEQLAGGLELAVPFARRFTATLSSRYARSLSTGRTTVGGLDDTELALTFAQPVALPPGQSSLVVNLAVGLPSGKQRLSGQASAEEGITGELGTTTLTSQDFYGLPVEAYGEGLSVAPSVALAVPAGERVSLGLGATYRYRRRYRPVEGFDNAFDPGDELVGTVGVTLGPVPKFVLSLDLTYTYYFRDELSGLEAIQSGDQVALTAEAVRRFRGGRVRVAGRYESQAPSSVPRPEEELTDQVFIDQQLIPQQGFVQGQVRVRVREWLWVTPEVEGRFFGRTEGAALQTEAKSLVVGRLRPEVRLEEGVVIGMVGGYTAGSFRGYEVGLRLGYVR